MTQQQFIKQEVYKFVREFDNKTSAIELARMIEEGKIEYFFNEEENEILIEGHGIRQTMGWSDEKGIVSLPDEMDDVDNQLKEIE